jgi:hypothetical protein
MQDPRQLPQDAPSERITITNEAALEQARLRSVAPPPDELPPEPGSLSMLNDEMHARFLHRDLTGALAVAEAILARWNDADARECADACRAKLIARYVARIGSLEQVPVVVVPLAEIGAVALDYRAAFLLSQVDGHTSLDTILDVSGMPVLETLRIVSDLARRGVIAFRGRASASRVMEWRKR